MKWIFTHTGKHVHLLDHQPDPIVLADIAHGLSHKCRFSALMHNAIAHRPVEAEGRNGSGEATGSAAQRRD